jgi:type IV pilus assembly protein PilB
MNSPIEATILTVDDDPVNRKIIERVLKQNGYRVVEADSGVKSIEVLHEIRPDLILLDVMMPGMDGYELCAKLQENADTADIPVVFITALGEKRDRAQGFALGAVDYVTKPVQTEALAQLVAAQIQTSERWKKLREHRGAKGLTGAVPTDFVEFKRFLFDQCNLTDDATAGCANLTPIQLYAALSEQGIDEGQVALSIANFTRLPYLPYIEPEDVQMGVLSPPFAKANLAMAINRNGKNMFTLSNPFDRGLIEALTKFSGLGDQFALAITAPRNVRALFDVNPAANQGKAQPPTNSTATVRRVFKPDPTSTPRQSSPAVTKSTTTSGFSGAAASNLAVAQLDDLSHDTMLETESVLRLADRLLAKAVAERASDIHIEPKGHDSVFRLRVDGDMREVSTIKKDTSLMLVSRLKALAGMDIAERRRPQDGACEVKIDGRSFKLRMATTSTPDGESLIIRLLEPGGAAKALTDLGMTEQQSRDLTAAARSTQGLILIVGPTGSGKTTTIFSVLSHVDTQSRSLISVEDPVEYRIPFANQQQVNDKAGINFETLLKSAMRQDPDILFLGEIRDPFSAKASMDFASTGHLTISTLHTSNATSAIFRLERLGVTRTMMADSILCVVAQRLLKKLCSYCKDISPITQEEADRLAPFARQLPPEIAHPVGCSKCNQSGYSSREGVYEIVKFDAEIADMIHANKPASAIREFAYKRQDYLIAHHAVEKVSQMLISADDAYQKVLAEEGTPPTDVAAIKSPPLHPGPAKETAKAASREGEKMAILLVEDDKDNQALIRRYLEGQGYQVTIADDGIDALMQLGRTKFDLILSDVNMPNLDGFKLLETAKQKKIATPIVMLTAETDEASEIKGFQLGVTEYLRKPIKKELFLLRIKKILGL